MCAQMIFYPRSFRYFRRLRSPLRPFHRTLTSPPNNSISSNLEITYLQIRSGRTVPLPQSTLSPIKPNLVAFAGEETLDKYFEPNTPRNIEANKSQDAYRRLRPFLLSQFGRWIVVNKDSVFYLDDTEAKVRNTARLIFPNQEYHVACIGCEYLEMAFMDSYKKTTPETEQFEEALPTGKFSCLFEAQFLVRAKYSFDGSTFIETVMKFDSGVTHMGAPVEVLSNPPSGIELNRGPDLWSQLCTGKTVKVRQYFDIFVDVAGLVTRTSFVDSHVWLLGYPVISRFVTTLNVKANEPVVMNPLENEKE